MVRTGRVKVLKNDSGRRINAGELVELTPAGGVRPVERPKFTAQGDVITGGQPQMHLPNVVSSNTPITAPGHVVPTGDWSEEYGQHAYGWGMAHEALAKGFVRKEGGRETETDLDFFADEVVPGVKPDWPTTRAAMRAAAERRNSQEEFGEGIFDPDMGDPGA